MGKMDFKTTIFRAKNLYHSWSLFDRYNCYRSNQYRHAIELNKKKGPRYEDSRSHEWQKGKGLEVNCESLPIKLTYETIP